MLKGKLKVILLSTGFVLLLSLTALIAWLIHIDNNMRERISKGWFLPPIEIYSQSESVFERQQLKASQLIETLKQDRYRLRHADQKLFPGDYALWEGRFCEEYLEDEPDELDRCVIFKTLEQTFGPSRNSKTYLAAFHNGVVTGIYESDKLIRAGQWQLPPRLFAQFYGGKPILRSVARMGEIPMNCLNAVTAIEDSQFLEHRGVSPLGILRAMGRNLLEGRYAQGGSTITQQLVRNYFLTLEKKLSRKIKEVFMSILLELRVSKDEILETYLNVIYMGQNGPFQVRGFGSASQHYLAKPLDQLEVHECALLAAIINSPGRYNPFKHPEKALHRRNLVLKRMADTKVLDEVEAHLAKKKPLPKRPPKTLKEPAPYFVQAIHRELKELGISADQGLRVFSSMSEKAQSLAQKSVTDGIDKLENGFLSLLEKKKAGNHLEAALISVNLKTGGINAIIGGRHYRQTQYNRILDAHRQVGSIMKPFVYLAALESFNEDGQAYNPLSIIPDEEFTHKYEGQEWSPKNFDEEFHGDMPLFYALKNSINAATAHLGIQTGLKSIVDVAKRAGIESEIKPYPSLTLGAFEIYPRELAQAYSTIARMGSSLHLHSIQSIESLNGDIIHEEKTEPEIVFNPATVAVLIGMMKQTLRTGTGRGSYSRGFTHPAAGKTGTTSDTKDAWFAGFTPNILTIVWVGYDNNENHGLTGASGAVPIWTDFMKAYALQFPPDDFTWPEGAIPYSMSAERLREVVVAPKEHELQGQLELVFRSENRPSF